MLNTTPKNNRINVRFKSRDEFEALLEIAKENQVSPAEVLRVAWTTYLDKRSTLKAVSEITERIDEMHDVVSELNARFARAAG